MRCWDRTAVVLVAGLALVLDVQGCSWHRPVAGPGLQEATAEQLIERLRTKEAEIQTLKGLFRAQIQGPGIPIPQRVEGALFYQRPDLFRVRGFNRLGGELFELVMASNLYRLRLPGPGQQYSGQADQLGRMGPVAEPFELTVFAMSGITGNAAIPVGTSVTVAEDKDRYRLDVFGEPAGRLPVRRMWFDRRTLHVVQEDRLSPDGELAATARFDDFRRVSADPVAAPEPITQDEPAGGIMRPFRITVQDSKAGAMVVLTFQELTANIPLTPEELRAEPRPASAEPAS